MTNDHDVRPWPGMTTDARMCPTYGKETTMRAERSGLCFYLCPQGHRHTLPDVLNPPSAPAPLRADGEGA